MPPHNLVMYHCQKCGRVVKQEVEEVIPYCCGRQMTKAAAVAASGANGSGGNMSNGASGGGDAQT